jgi:DNA-binding response OmpR family regulator
LRLLVIEDEDRLSGILKSKLGEIGFTVDIAASAADASAALELINYDAAVLDLGLPDGDGPAVLTAARQAGKALPILILTARDAVEDRVAGLNGGADDYLTKPFAMTELVARIKALLGFAVIAVAMPNRTLPLGSRNGEVGAPSYRTGQWGSSLPLVSRPISIATTLNSAKQTMIAAATLKPPSATASNPAISGPKLVITLAAPLQNATPVDRMCVGNSSGK